MPQKYNHSLQQRLVMFCCTENPTHMGEIVTSICQDPSCIEKQSQMCCSICIRDLHSSHIKEVISMKEMLPQLLQANNIKNYYESILSRICEFIEEEFSHENIVKQARMAKNGEGGGVGIDNVAGIVEQIMMSLKKVNREENKKLLEIEKTLHSERQQFGGGHVGSNNNNYSAQKHTSAINTGGGGMTGRNNNSLINSSPLKMGHNQYETVPMTVSQVIGNMDTFSHTMKHPYVTLSSDCKQAVKNSEAGGYKLAALSAASISVGCQNVFFYARVEKSRGNVMLGLAIPEVIQKKQFLNVYGSGQGGFLLGQNGNDAKTSILFHHCDNMFNRKEIVGWNYREGEVVGIGLIKQNGKSFISFRLCHVTGSGKVDHGKILKQFAMPLFPQDKQKYDRLHFIALLQNVGDTVSIVSPDQ